MTTSTDTRPAAFALPTDVETPAAVVDLDVLDRNIAETAARAAGAGVALRPHAAGHGYLVDAPGAVVRTLTEEHAVVTGAPDRWAVGDVVALVPNHVCTTVNLARRLVVTSAGRQVATWDVGAQPDRRDA